MLTKSMLLNFNSLLRLIRITRSGVKLGSICWWCSRRRIRKLHSGLDCSNLNKKTSIFKSIGPNGLTKMRRSRTLTKDLEALTLHKCKVKLLLYLDFGAGQGYGGDEDDEEGNLDDL